MRPIRISLTTGDVDGIGPEITAKALEKIKPQKNVQFILWRSPKFPNSYLGKIDSQFKRITVNTWPEALNIDDVSSKTLIDINSQLDPAKWVELSAQAAMFNHIDAIATAPMSKTQIQSSGYNKIGHTEILQTVAKCEDVHMAFIGKKFSVLLATPHIPLKNVSKALNLKVLKSAIRSANQLRSLLSNKQAKHPIAVLGLNPHAGENGLIGNEEEIIKHAISDLKKGKIPIEGPLVPDAAFFESNWKKYSVYVACYHDQGLIPFKMIHGQESGVHITMGLPFLRTSVDHGTAKNIFGKNKANPSSMIEAIQTAIKLAKSSQTAKMVPTLVKKKGH